MKLRIALAAVALALAAPAAASAHGSSAYVATVRAITPHLRGVHAWARRDGGLVVSNRSGRTVTVIGANGRPYLRLGSGEVDANLGRGTAPHWVRVARGRTFSWEDPRTTIESA